MKYDRLVVTGCEFSVDDEITSGYGNHLAKLLDLSYLNLSEKNNNNDKIWRTVTSRVLCKTLKSTDLLVIQYTDPFRKEFPSHPYEGGCVEKSKCIMVADKWYYTTKFSKGSHKTQAYRLNKKMHLVYEDFLDPYFNLDNIFLRHRQFSAFCHFNKINVLFYINKQLSSFLIEVDKMFKDKTNSHYMTQEKDNHQDMAQELYSYITKNMNK